MSESSNNNKPYRWITLFLFALVAGVSQILMLGFAPLISWLQNEYAISESTASLNILLFPLLYVVLSIYSGVLIDKRGYKYAVSLGAILMSAGACLRVFVDDFSVILVGSFIIAIGHPFVINSVTKLVSDWFSKEDSALATGIGVCGILLGMTFGLSVSPLLVESIGFQNTMIVFAALTIGISACFIIFARVNTLSTEIAIDKPTIEIMKILYQKKDIRILIVAFFFAMGMFNGITTWLEKILGQYGLPATDAGLVGGIFILGGIIGSIIMPLISDKLRRRKPFLVFANVSALFLIYPLTSHGDMDWLLIVSFSMGFLFLPCYAIALQVSEELVGDQYAGSAVGMLLLAGNAGGIIAILGMEIVKGDSSSWTNSVLLMIGFTVIATVANLRLSESFKTTSYTDISKENEPKTATLEPQG